MRSNRTRRRAWTQAALAGCAVLLVSLPTVAAQAADAPEPFVISGGLTETLFPGASAPLDLQLFNPNDGLLAVLSLSARIDSVRPIGQGTCTIADFEVQNVLALGPLVVPPGVTNLLSDLGVPALGMPQVRMLNTDENQDGCKQAEVRLVYEGAGLTEETGGGNGGGGNGGGGNGGGRPTPGHGDNGVGDGHLPGTGASNAPWWIAAFGLGIAGVGTGALRLTRRATRENQ